MSRSTFLLTENRYTVLACAQFLHFSRVFYYFQIQYADSCLFHFEHNIFWIKIRYENVFKMGLVELHSIEWAFCGCYNSNIILYFQVKTSTKNKNFFKDFINFISFNNIQSVNYNSYDLIWISGLCHLYSHLTVI